MYVRPSGNDTTGDGTLSRPFRTLKRALRAVPVIDPGDIRFVVDNTGCVETDPIVFPPFASGQIADYGPGTDFAPYWPEGYVTLQAIPTALDVLNGPTTAFTYDSLSGLATVQDTSKTWAKDQFKGKWLVGSGWSDLAAIAGNAKDTLDTTALGPSAPWPPFTPPLRIVDAGAELNGSVILAGVRAPISFNGQRITQPGEPYAVTLYVNNCLEFDAALCELRDPWVENDFAFIRAYIHGEGGGNITDTVFNNGWGVFQGYVADCTPDTSTGFTIIQGIVENCPMPFGFSPSGQFANCECRKTAFALGAGAISVLHLKVDDVPGDAISANGPGALDLYAVGTGPTVGGFGLHASNGAQVHVNANVNPTGVGGDFIVGQNPKRTWTNFRTAAPFRNEIDQTPGTGDGSRVWE